MGEVIRKAVYHNYAFWICLITSIILLLGSALVPPFFIIDNSIFAGVGELFAFAALGAFSSAIDKGLDARIKRGDMTIEVGDLDKKDEE